MTTTEFLEDHVEALVEGANEVITTLEAFKDVLSLRPNRNDFRAAAELLERARKEIEMFDVAEDL